MNCETNYLPPKEQLEAMMRHSGNLNGLPIVEVAGHTENANSCGRDLTHLTFIELLMRSIGVDACGKPAIRVKFIASCTNLKTCLNNSVKSEFHSMFAYDSTAKTFALVINKSV